MNPELSKVREWAQAELDALQEPPWAAGRYQHLINCIDRMLATPPPEGVARPLRAKVVNICSARRRYAGQSR